MTEDNITITKYPIVKYGENFPEIVDNLPEPKGSEVIVKVHHCGVCHSDLHLKEGHFNLGNERKFSARALHRLPHTLGHEIEGEVVALGPEAENIELGDNRIVYAWIGCGKCKPCQQGNEHLCTRPRHLGITQDGGYATHVTVPHSRYLLDYTGIPAEQAGSFMCAGLTAYGALNRFDKNILEATRLIIGFGGVGMMALQLSKLMFKEPVLVADTDADKRKLALEMGALDAFDPTDAKQRNEIIKKHGTIDAILDLVGTEKTADYSMGMINKGGKLVLAGLFGGELAYPIPYFSMKGIAVEGSYVGSLQDAKDMLKLVRDGDYQPIQTCCRPLSEVNEALDDLASGKVDGRVVLECK